MSNEILVNTTSGLNLVAVITNHAGLTWAGGNTFLARTNTTVLAHPVTVSEIATSGQYAADFPAAITTAGEYTIAVYSVATPGVLTLAEVQARPQAQTGNRPFVWTGAAEAAAQTGDSFPFANRTVIRGTVGVATTPSTTAFTPSALSPVGVDADQFKGRIIIFDNDTTTTALRGQATDVLTASAAALPLLTFTALTRAPASGDTFSIV